jgi:predicted CXXCH cytochrome family protein
MRRAWRLSLALALTLLGAAAGAAWAVEGSGEAGRTPVPHPPKGRGEHCVADTEFMRRNHMSMLFHQRGETVHLGVRGKPYSLAACVDCHAVRGADGGAVTYADPRHFCRSCHDYAAVFVDCFECHASRPGEPNKAAAIDADGRDLAALNDYLKETKP